MNLRHLTILGAILIVVFIASLSAVVKRRISSPKPVETASTTAPAERDIRTGNPLVGRPNMVDRLDFIDSAQTFDDATFQHVSLSTTRPVQIALSDQRPRTFPREGTWTSEVAETEFAFTELIPSWNATTPPNTGVMFHVQTRDATSQEWSPWLYVGQWGRTPAGPAGRVMKFAHGVVHVDNLLLDRPADAYQFRATLLSFDLNKSVNPSIRRIAISYSGEISDAAERKRLAEDPKIDPQTGLWLASTGSAQTASSSEWARSLPVPFRAQGIEVRPLAGSICSPTSTSMVMAYFGVDRPTEENALAIYDEQHDMFGNWGRAVQRAGELGLDAWLQRFRNWDQVKAMIARGQPVVAGIKFKRGEFPGALYPSTAGHLIVIRGFTREGDVIVNDPADRKKGNGVVYKADELAKAWFGCGGVGYVIRKPAASGTIATREQSSEPRSGP